MVRFTQYLWLLEQLVILLAKMLKYSDSQAVIKTAYLATIYSHQNLSLRAKNLSTHFFAPEERSFSNGSHLIAAFMEMNKPTQAGKRGLDAASTLPSDASSKRQATSQGKIATEDNFHSYRPGCWQILVLSARWRKTCSAYCPT
ncbi:hypothetical protein TNCV_4561381 [Trichonephila clavipes]|nr:hypothetical protein TNCV_4561381 [Trichonephila clavipes]